MADTLQERLRRRVVLNSCLLGNVHDLDCHEAADALDAAEAEIASLRREHPVCEQCSVLHSLRRMTAERDAAFNEAIEAAARKCDELDMCSAGYAAGEIRRLKRHASDCATHNAPAMKPGPCDCQQEDTPCAPV